MTMSPPKDINQADLPLADRAFYGLFWAGNLLSRRVEEQLKRAHDLPISWFEVLLWLSYQDTAVSVSDLGSCTMLSRSQVSRVLDALQDRGLVQRLPVPGDARAVGVRLTPAGRKLFEEADASKRACLEELFTSRLDDDDLSDLIRVWRKLRTA